MGSETPQSGKLQHNKEIKTSNIFQQPPTPSNVFQTTEIDGGVKNIGGPKQLPNLLTPKRDLPGRA